MKKLFCLTTAFAAGLVLLLSSIGGTQEPGLQPEEGIEPLTRGPVHEAYLELHVAHAEPSPAVGKQPPDPIEELPPDQRPEGENVVWISGYWAWDDDRTDFVWVSGFWRDVPPDRNWVPGYWAQTDNGWQWVSGFWASAQQEELVYYPPPPEPIEAGPSTPPPEVDCVYVPGVWMYRETRYAWRPGFWAVVRPGWVYVPARYYWTPVGHIFCDGYWDYPLQTRGVLFTPVYFTARVWVRPDWYFRPRYAVPSTTLMTALFARPRFNGYFFGDYFEARHARAGYVPWTEYAVTRGTVNPLFGYYRARFDQDWETDLRQLYVARREGRAPRPPATWREQVTIVQNITTNNTVNIGKQVVRVDNGPALVQQLTMATPLAAISKVETQVKLQQVPQAAVARQRQATTELRKVAQERRQIDNKIRRSETKDQGVTRAKISVPTPAVARQQDGKPRLQVPPPPDQAAAPQKGAPPQAGKQPDVKPKQPAKGQNPPAKAARPKDDPREPRPPLVLPKDEKRAAPPVVQPKEGKKAPPPVTLPKDEKKAAPPITLPKDSKKEPRPPVVLPKDEKKVAPPAVQPKDEKKAAPPAVQPKDEKKAAPPKAAPKAAPKEDRKEPRPPVTLPREDKAPAKPAVVPPVEKPRFEPKGRPEIPPPSVESKGRPEVIPPRPVPAEPKGRPEVRPSDGKKAADPPRDKDGKGKKKDD